MTNWIRMREQKPEDAIFLGYSPSSRAQHTNGLSIIKKNDEYFWEQMEILEISHWLPLPIPPKRNDLIPIDKLQGWDELNVRLTNILCQNKIEYKQDLIDLTLKKVFAMRNMGKKTAKDLINFMEINEIKFSNCSDYSF